MQKHAVVVFNKRNGEAAVKEMNRKDWGNCLRPLGLILLPKPGSEK